MESHTERDRPQMPDGYGVGDPQYGFEPIEWSWVVDQISGARNYWVATNRPDGPPHVVPVWGVWLNDSFHFFTDPGSLKGRNIRRDPRVVVHLESGDHVVILEGEMLPHPATAEIITAYEAKYDISFGDDLGDVYTLDASKVLAWTENDFPKTATRWQF